MKKNILLVLALIGFINVNAQITFRGCTTNALGAQDFILVMTGTTNDAGTIRNTFESSPADFTQGCPAGVCELRFIWNIGAARWEIQLDNDGPLGTPDYTTAVLYYNTAPSEPNPPSLLLGTWVDGTGVSCPLGELTVLSGDVQDTPLGINDVDLLNKQITMSPNPANNILNIASAIHELEAVEIYSLLGKKIKTINTNFSNISVADLPNNMYLVKIETTEGIILNKKLLVN